MAIKAVVFDFGGVLIDWDREYVYRKLIADDTERRWFLDHVVAMDWVLQQDAGQTIADGNAELIARFPEHEALIRAFYERWHEMVGGVLEEGVALVDKLDAAGVPLFGLTNWSAETFPWAWERFAILRQFREVMFSRLVPNLREIGLLSPRIVARYERVGLMQYFGGLAADRLSGEQMVADLDRAAPTATAAAVAAA